MEFSRQEYWSGLPFLSPGNIPDRKSNPCLLCLLHCRRILYPLSYWGSPKHRGITAIRRLACSREWLPTPVFLPGENSMDRGARGATLGMGYLFMAAPAKRSHCSLPWTRGISSWLPLLQRKQWHSTPVLLPGTSHGQRSLRSLRVGHNWSGWAAAAGKITRPFRYDLIQIPYDYTVEVRNRFKGIDLIDSAWSTMDGGL